MQKGFIAVDEGYQTNDPQVFAIGDAVKPGLLTEAIGAGRVAAQTIDGLITGIAETYDKLPAIDFRRVKLAYFDPRIDTFTDATSCAVNCASCGACRDCGMCETICPVSAISRRELGEATYEYRVDEELCIGCGFCVGACPTGIWELVENSPLE